MWRRNRPMSKSSLEWFSITGAQNISSRFSTIKTWPTNLDTWSRRRLPITNLTESFLSFGVSSADKPSFKQHNLWVKQTNRLKMITWLKLKVKVTLTEIFITFKNYSIVCVSNLMRLSRRKMILIFSNKELFTKTAPIHDNIVEVFMFVLELLR